MKAYLNERPETEAIMHPTLYFLEVINVSVNLFPACTNTSWQKKIPLSLRKIRSYAPTVRGAWNHVLEDILMEDIIAEYKAMYIENIDYEYTSRNIITKMCKHLWVALESSWKNFDNFVMLSYY